MSTWKASLQLWELSEWIQHKSRRMSAHVYTRTMLPHFTGLFQLVFILSMPWLSSNTLLAVKAQRCCSTGSLVKGKRLYSVHINVYKRLYSVHTYIYIYIVKSGLIWQARCIGQPQRLFCPVLHAGVCTRLCPSAIKNMCVYIYMHNYYVCICYLILKNASKEDWKVWDPPTNLRFHAEPAWARDAVGSWLITCRTFLRECSQSLHIFIYMWLYI